MLNYLIQKSYYSQKLCKITSALTFLIGGRKEIVKVLQINMSHYNFDNRYLLKKLLMLIKNKKNITYNEVGLIIDSWYRLYGKSCRKEIFLKLNLPENLPFGYCGYEKETALVEINEQINYLSKIDSCTLFSSSSKTIELIFYDYILDKNSLLDFKTKQLLTRIYRTILKICNECEYNIIPVFCHRWSCNKDTKTEYDLCIGHHFRTDNNKHLMFKRSYLHDYIYFDNKGFSGWSSATTIKLDELSHPTTNEVEAFYENIKIKYLQRNLSKYKQSEKLYDGPIAEIMIFCALQTTNDTVTRLSYIKTLDMVKQVVNFYKDRKNAIVIIKRHPYCKDINVTKYLHKISKKVKNIVISDASIHSLIDVASLVIVANSGVGFEALLHLKPVVTTAKTDYGIATEICSSNKELHYYLKCGNFIANTDKIKRFLYVFMNDYNICLEDESFDEIIKNKIKQSLNN